MDAKLPPLPGASPLPERAFLLTRRIPPLRSDPSGPDAWQIDLHLPGKSVRFYTDAAEIFAERPPNLIEALRCHRRYPESGKALTPVL